MGYSFLKKTIIALCILIALFSLAALFPDLSPAAENPARPKIRLALGGGGAKGAAHIGVLKVLEELKIPIDYIAGTSMGAIVGSLYASGMSSAEIEEVLTTVDWDDIFSDNPSRKDIDFRRKQEDLTFLSKITVGIKDRKVHFPKGVISGQKIDVFFETLMMPVAGVKNFDRLPIPFRAIATDIETGEMVVIGSGSLAEAARASMSVPGVFSPIDVNGHYLIDGGIVRNLPVDIVRDMGADIVIAVDVGKPLPTREELNTPLSIMNQMLDIMIKQNVQAQIDSLGKEDVFIRPDLGTISSADFKRGMEAAERGERAARQKEKDLRLYAVTEEEYDVFLANHRQKQVSSITVGSVTVEGLSMVSPEAVASKVKIREGDRLDMETLKKDVGLIYGMGDFERVDLEVNPRGDAYDIILRMTEKSWGPNYLRLGVNLETDFEGNSEFNVLADYTMRWINRLGAEWKNQV